MRAKGRGIRPEVRKEGWPLDGEDAGGPMGTWWFIKVTGKPCVRKRHFVFTGHVN